MVIVTHIWQKLSSVERKVTLIVTNFWQLFSQIFGETLLIVTNIWQNQTCFAQDSQRRDIFMRKDFKQAYLPRRGIFSVCSASEPSKWVSAWTENRAVGGQGPLVYCGQGCFRG